MPLDRHVVQEPYHQVLTSLSDLFDDDYIGKARDNHWLLMNDSVATPAVTNRTEDLQIRMTLEPFKDFKIDLTASRMQTTSRSIQYMYTGTPTTQSGSLTMTTLS